SENKGMGSETAAALSRVSGSWPFTSLGPSGCFGGMLAKSAVITSSSLLFSSAITPPLSFPQSLVPAPVPRRESGSESSPSSDLPLWLRLSQPAAQSHAETGSSPPLGDGRRKCPRHVDRNRIWDSPEFSLKRTPGHRLLRLPPFLFGATRSWHALAQSRRQSNLVVLFVDQDLANLFAHGIFSQVLALADSLAIISNRFRFVVEIELQHLGGFFRCSDGLGFNRRHTAEIINLLGDDQGVTQFLRSVLFKFARDVHELSTLQDL